MSAKSARIGSTHRVQVRSTAVPLGSVGSGLVASALAVPALPCRDQRLIHVRGDQSRAVKIDEQAHHLARGIELVAAIAGESINEASRAHAAEPGRGDLHRPAPTAGAQRAIAGGCNAGEQHGFSDRPRALLCVFRCKPNTEHDTSWPCRRFPCSETRRL